MSSVNGEETTDSTVTGSSGYPSTSSYSAAPSQWPDYNAAYAAYYQQPPAQTPTYGQFGANIQNSGAPSAVPQYTGYPQGTSYPTYPPYVPNPVPAPVSDGSVPVPPSADVGVSGSDSAKSDGNIPPNGVPPTGPPQPYYPAQAPYNGPGPQSYYNYGMNAAPYGQQPPYPGPPNPYSNQYNNPPPSAGYPPPPPPQAPNSGYFNSRPIRPYNRNVNTQPPAWTNDPGTIKVEGFPTDITLDELRATFKVGALKRDHVHGYDQICVSPGRQCAFLTFEDPTVADAAVVMLNESSIRGQKIAVQLYDGNYQNQGFKRRSDDNHNDQDFNKRPRFESGNRDFRDRGPNWPCVACNASNHAHRWNCYKCRTPKPDLDNKNGGAPGTDPNFPSTHTRTAEDWICASCNNHNFAKRLICNRCKLPKPANPQLAPMTGANNTPLGAKPSYNFTPPMGAQKDGWKCDPCGTSNDMTKLICSKCSQPKPGIPQKTLDVLHKLNAIKSSEQSSGAGTNGQSSSSRWGDK